MKRSLPKPFSCNICGRVLATAAALTNHSRSHSGYRPFRCNACNRGFIHEDQYLAHLPSHANDKFPCLLCKRTFQRAYHLKGHMRLHNGDRPYEYSAHEKELMAINRGWDRERRPHNVTMGYKYPFCYEQYAVPGKLHNGMPPDTDPFACLVGGQSFAQPGALEQHIDNCICRLCDKRFERQDQLKAHLSTHTEVESIAGDSEVRTLGREPAAQYHSGTRMSDRPSICAVCNRCYLTSWHTVQCLLVPQLPEINEVNAQTVY